MNKNHLVLFIILSIFLVPSNPILASKVEETRLKSISLSLDHIKQILNFGFFAPLNESLNKNDIIFWTNNARSEKNIKALTSDPDLDIVAMIRLEDMEKKQYFDHYSPEGRGIRDESNDFGYKFIAIGENLAEGTFKDSKTLVEAWMKSSGHRENILKKEYSKIGVAVKEIVFEGEKSWLIVQAFSRPLSECSQPSTNLRDEISELRREVQDLMDEANKVLLSMTSLEKIGGTGSYNKLVPTYNSLVKEVNTKTTNLQSIVSDYNREVVGFNYCLVRP